MEEIVAYVEKAEKFLKTAQKALEVPDFDSVTSRCYYAMFFMAKALLITQDVTAQTHSGVHSKFAELFVRTGIFERKYSKYLKHAFELRSVGDYDVFLPIDLEVAQDLLQTAQKFCSALKEYLQNNGYL